MVGKLTSAILTGAVLFGGSFTLSDAPGEGIPSQVNYRDLKGKVPFPDAVSDLVTPSESGGLVAAEQTREIRSPEDPQLMILAPQDRIALLVHGTSGWSEEFTTLLYRRPTNTGRLGDAVQEALQSAPIVVVDKNAPRVPVKIVPLSLAKKSKFAEVEARYNALRNRSDD